MIISPYEQGTNEWMLARAGIPTASNFAKIITTKGDPSKQKQKYMLQLAGERLLHAKSESYQSKGMKRGIELEPDARLKYEIMTGNDVKEVGLCYYDDKQRIGASPDGLVSTNGEIEIKCPELDTFIQYKLSGGLYKDYFQQVQGQLYVTSREWCDLIAFYPGAKPIIERIERDELFIVMLEAELEKFCDDLDEIVANLIEKGW